MHNGPKDQVLHPKVVDELQTQYLRIKAAVSAAMLWERVLTPRERQQLGGDLEASYARLGTVGMWRQLRGVSQVRAVVDVAQVLGFLDETKRRWLLREVGEELPPHDLPDRPSWRPATGRLRWRKQVIRTVRILSRPSNVRMILDAFEEAGWPPRIKNPLRNGRDQQQLHQALRSLNKGLKKIHFHAQEGGRSITWTIA